MGPTPFIPGALEKSSIIKRLDTGVYEVQLSPSFAIGAVPNGGYVASLFVRAAADHLQDRNQTDTMTAHWQYLGRTQAGRAVITIEDIKLGRTQSVLHMSLHQDNLLSQTPWVSSNKREITAYLTNINLEAETGISLPAEWTLDHPPPAADLAKLPTGRDAHWTRMHAPVMDRIPAASILEFYERRTGHVLNTVHDYWIRMASGEPFTTASLAYVVDTTPVFIFEGFRPAGPDSSPTGMVQGGGFAYDQLFWFPTLVMGLEVKRRLASAGEEWLRLRSTAKVIENGRFDTETVVFDVQGRMVALSNQVAMAVDMTRNYDKRTKGKM